MTLINTVILLKCLQRSTVYDLFSYLQTHYQTLAHCMQFVLYLTIYINKNPQKTEVKRTWDLYQGKLIILPLILFGFESNIASYAFVLRIGWRNFKKQKAIVEFAKKCTNYFLRQRVALLGENWWIMRMMLHGSKTKIFMLLRFNENLVSGFQVKVLYSILCNTFSLLHCFPRDAFEIQRSSRYKVIIHFHFTSRKSVCNMQ